ncbi:cation transporter [Psychrobacter sp. FDAARGOS_221]|uniref:cation transporter n=1 Tax=Psychrobacter sp. FDAARGOS_221 TaxID=1975705 RepID=UPI000BB599DF|nr:cation transporter [Psychrobacter sp. FDAARGOS_221]PNK60019.1 hypothetical protein A6J60_003410 [Psychrobacter sp. FDAARGOS_221]
MAKQVARFDIDNIDDTDGIESVVTALQNIDGVTHVEINAENKTGVVHYDDEKTSVHAFKAAVNTVDYITQPFPEDAPQNPDNDR